MNEKKYFDPELIPVRFAADDVIATSGDAIVIGPGPMPGGNNDPFFDDEEEP